MTMKIKYNSKQEVGSLNILFIYDQLMRVKRGDSTNS